MHIYIIKEKQTKFIKIGYAKDIQERLRILQIGNPRKLVVYKYFIIGNDSMEEQARCSLARKLESKCHNAMCEYGARGEWFYVPYIEEAVKIVENILQLPALDFNKQEATELTRGNLTYKFDGTRFILVDK